MKASPDLQISAFLANRAGVVAHLSEALAERGVNIRAMTVLDTVDIGTMRMLVDNVEVAKEALDVAGAAYVEVPVVTIPIPNTLGAFARISRAIADAGINIEYVYASSVPGADYTLGVFRVSDHRAALALEFDVESAEAMS
ncbi:MAG: ACT domain-containing protein [Planctomycetota bacterium]